MAKIKVYLDNCAYNRPFDDQEQIKIFLEAEAKKHIQWLIVDQKIDLAYSFINRFENSRNPNFSNKNAINSFFSNAILYIDHTHAASVGGRAIDIMKAGIKTRDAYHISSAIESGCDYFITTDKALLNYKTGKIIICDPIQFLNYYYEEQENG
jgi:predicted nucleic acid-binding protein